jgi:energy-coupling factor transporter ATP-binding protein EcfA2
MVCGAGIFPVVILLPLPKPNPVWRGWHNMAIVTRIPIIEARDVFFSYEEGPVILKDVNVAVAEGEFIGLIGQNGSGKTTLVKNFNGLLKPTAGTVRVDGRDTKNHSITVIAKTVGFVFQNPDHQIFCPTVKEELSFGPRNTGMSDELTEETVQEAMRRFNLEHSADYPPSILGFGIRRKVSLAAIYAMRPLVMILDEPTTGLDWKSAMELMQIITELNGAGHTIILITHDMRVIAEFTKRSIVMRGGEIVADGPTRDVLVDFAMLAKTQIVPSELIRLSETCIGKGLTDYAFSNEEFLENFKPAADRKG